MEWDQIDKLLNEQIANKVEIKIGYEQIKQVLKENNLPVVEIDLEELKREFEEWLSEVLIKEPIPKKIKSIYFGLVTMSIQEIDEGKPKTILYFAGSRLTPEEDLEWACEPQYLPSSGYALLEEFIKIDEAIKQNGNLTGEYEVLVFNGLLNLLIINSINKFREKLLTYHFRKLWIFKTKGKRNSLHIGAGYDSGDVYLLGEIKNE